VYVYSDLKEYWRYIGNKKT